MIRRVILEPRRIFFMYCLLTVCTMYSVLSLQLACDHRYGLIFSLIVFLCLEIDYARIAQCEKIKHYAIIFIVSILRGTRSLLVYVPPCAIDMSRVVFFIIHALSAKYKLCY